MNHLTKLHFNLPISSSINPKLLLNTIEKKVFLLAIAIFSTVSLLCFAVFTYLKNRKAVEIKNKENKEEQVNKEDQFSEMSYEKEDIEKVFEIYTNQNTDTSKKNECEYYFKKALAQSPDKMKEFYRIVSEQPAILDMVINHSFEIMNINIDQPLTERIYSNLCEILNSSYNPTFFGKTDHAEIFINLLQKFLNHGVRDSSMESGKRCQRTIKHLFEHVSSEEITKLILNKASDPLNLIESLIKILDDEIKAKVVEAALPSFKDPEKLEKLYCMSYQFAIGFFTPEAIEILFRHWMKTLNEDEYLEKISQLIDRVVSDKSIDNIIALESVLAANPEIKLKKLITQNDRYNVLIGERPKRILPYLCAFYAMRHYNDESHSLADKIKKMNIAIIYTDPIKNDNLWKDERTIFGSYLAERCSDNQLRDIFNGLTSFKGVKQRLIEAFLKTILKSNKSDRIICAFEAYWIDYEDIKEDFPRTEWVLLGEIKSENVLKAVYQSIQKLPQVKKEAIINLLRNGESYNNNGIQTHYKVDLLPDTINKIVG